MPITDVLSRRPQILPATLPLTRVRDFLLGTILWRHPLYIASHWRNGRSFPCLRTLLTTCPWCAACERREHAYLPCAINNGGSQTSTAVLELPTKSVPADVQLYGKIFKATRRSKRAPLYFDVTDRPADAPAPPTCIAPAETLRTIAKVYALPDPDAYATEPEWLLAVQIRVTDPDYTPAKHAPPP